MTNAVDTFIEQLKELPEEEQEACAAVFLKDLRRRKRAKRNKETRGHPSLTILQEAQLEGLPSDYSERLDHYLYGVGEE